MSKNLIRKGTSGTSGIILSRITGLARDMLIARFLGGGSVMSAWVLAFRIPNTFRGLLGEGAATQALIPILGNIIHKEGKEKFRRDLGTMIATLAIILAIVCIVVSAVCLAIRPYFPVYRVHAALSLMPILMPYTFFVCLTSICAGVLNIFDKYFLPALTAMVLNLFIIGALLIFYKTSPETQLVNISAASLLSGIFQLGWLLYLLKKEDAFSAISRTQDISKDALLREYFDTMILKDIIQRYNVSKPKQCIQLYKYLLANMAKPYTIGSAYIHIKQSGYPTSKDALKNYINYAEDSWLIFNVSLFSDSLKEVKRNYKKAYCIDWALANQNSPV